MAQVIYSEIANNPGYRGLAEVRPDISYSEKYPELKMTLLLPQAAQRVDDGKRYPAFVFVQGSGWTSPNIWYELAQMGRFAQQGYTVAMVTHRSALDGHRAPAFLLDVKTAVRYLREKAAEYHIDPGRIGIWGTSSGGNTALLAGLTGDDPAYRTEEYPGQSDHVKMVVDCFGPADAAGLLAGRLEELRALPPDDYSRRQFFGLLGETEAEQKERMTSIDPISKIRDRPYPPFLLVHGDRDPLVPYAQSEAMAEKLARHGVHTELVRVLGAEHEGTFWSPELFEKIAEFIRKTL